MYKYFHIYITCCYKAISSFDKNDKTHRLSSKVKTVAIVYDETLAVTVLGHSVLTPSSVKPISMSSDYYHSWCNIYSNSKPPTYKEVGISTLWHTSTESAFLRCLSRYWYSINQSDNCRYAVIGNSIPLSNIHSVRWQQIAGEAGISYSLANTSSVIHHCT